MIYVPELPFPGLIEGNIIDQVHLQVHIIDLVQCKCFLHIKQHMVSSITVII